MKIVLIGDINSIHLKKWVRWYNKNELETVVITDRVPDTNHPNKIHILPNLNEKRFPGDWTIKLKMNPKKVNKIIHSESPDVVHGHRLCNYLVTKNTFHPFVMNAWGSEVFQTDEGSWGEEVMKTNLVNADLVLGTSEIMLKTLNSKYKVPMKKMDQFSWGIDLKIFKGKKSKNVIRKELGIPKDRTVFISPRGISEIYRNPVIIKQFAKAIKQTDNAYLVLMGNNFIELEREKVEKLIKKYELKDHIKIKWERVSLEEIVDYYRASDFYVGIPKSDQLSSALLESMYCGCIPIVNDLPAYEGAIRDGKNGVVIPESDLEKLEETFISCSKPDPKFDKWRKLNIKYIEEKQDMDKTSMIMLKHYERLIEKFK